MTIINQFLSVRVSISVEIRMDSACIQLVAGTALRFSLQLCELPSFDFTIFERTPCIVSEVLHWDVESTDFSFEQEAQ